MYCPKVMLRSCNENDAAQIRDGATRIEKCACRIMAVFTPIDSKLKYILIDNNFLFRFWYNVVSAIIMIQYSHLA